MVQKLHSSQFGLQNHIKLSFIKMMEQPKQKHKPLDLITQKLQTHSQEKDMDLVALQQLLKELLSLQKTATLQIGLFHKTKQTLTFMLFGQQARQPILLNTICKHSTEQTDTDSSIQQAQLLHMLKRKLQPAQQLQKPQKTLSHTSVLTNLLASSLML